MLAHASLVVTAVSKRARHPPPSELIGSTCNQRQHRFAALLSSPPSLVAGRLGTAWTVGPLEDAMTVTADDLEAAVSTTVTTLRPATDRDWSVAAGALEWDCWHTAEHMGDVLLSYAAQLVAQPTTRYVRFLANADKDASPEEVLEFAAAGGRILAATVRTSPPQVRAWHPTGMADPEGFAGMGCVEALVHGHDIAHGFGLAADPPREVCARVLARMFPHAVADLADLDPWSGLLWATGRIALPGRPRVTRWRWHGAPPGGNG
jgi:hypothetical protein